MGKQVSISQNRVYDCACPKQEICVWEALLLAMPGTERVA